MTRLRPRSADRTALVLGGRGFLGAHVVQLLGGAAAVRVEAPSRALLDLADPDPLALLGLLRRSRPAVVVNATGRIGGSDDELWAGNVDVMARLLQACTEVVPGVRLVHLGSLAEYGPGTGRPFREQDAAAPVTGYGRAKLAATRLVVEASERGEVDGVVLRVANPLGAGQPAATLPGRIAAQLRTLPSGAAAADGEGVVRVASLAGSRDFVSAVDVARAVVAATSVAPDAVRGNRILNVGSGRTVALADLVTLMLTLGGFRGRLEVSDEAGSERSAAAGTAPLVPDVRRARDVLGWSAADDLDTALKAVLA